MSSIGFNVAPDRSVAELGQLARRCEELGYDDVWISEISDPDAFVVATTIALTTQRVRIGTSIVALGPRTVPILASAAASVADVSHGRFTLGLGVSTKAIVNGWHGVAAERPLERMRESVPLLRELLAGQRSEQSGVQVSSSGFRLQRPPTAPVPIMLAALNERMLEAAGELADAVMLLYVPLARLPAVIDTIRRGSDRAGRPLPEVILSVLCEVTDDPTAAYARWAHDFAFYLSAPPYRKALRWHGFGEEVDVAHAAFTSGGMKALRAAVSPRFGEQLAIIGDQDQCRDRIRELQAAGVSVALNPIGGSDPIPLLESISSALSLTTPD